MKCRLQILTTPTADTPGTSLLLEFDNKRYLIGHAAEGTQRANTESGVRLMKMNEMFLTGRTRWETCGGILGLILTLADAQASSVSAAREAELGRVKRAEQHGQVRKVRELAQETRGVFTIFGAPNLNYLIATARRFVFRKGMPLNVEEFHPSSPQSNDQQKTGPTWSDDNIKVWALPISPKSLPSRPAPSSPRKRSYEEANGDDVAVDEGEKLRDRQIVEGVVSSMFNSTWRLDALVETTLKEVHLPATLFQRNPETGKIENYTGPKPGDPGCTEDILNTTVLVRQPWPGAMITSLPKAEPSEDSVSYIFKNHVQRGKFLPQKAKELGIEPGSDFRKLTEGKSVVSKEGKTVTPDMVMTPPEPGNGFAVLDVPTVDHVQPVIDRQEWRSQEVMEGMKIFVWILGPGVVHNEALRQFMQQMKDIQHVVSSRDVCPDEQVLVSTTRHTAMLNMLDPERYRKPMDPKDIVKPSVPLPNNAVVAQRGHGWNIQPRYEYQPENIFPTFDPNDERLEAAKEFVPIADEAREAIEKEKEKIAAWQALIPYPDAEVITLGTGSALPSKYRNVSSTLVRVPGVGNYLLDAGENTLAQLQRAFNPSELTEVLQNLRLIWISHLHADHHLGTASVIRAWYAAVHNSQPQTDPSLSIDAFAQDPVSSHARSKRLPIISADGMITWLSEYANIEDFGYSHVLPLVAQVHRDKLFATKLGIHTPSTVVDPTTPSDLVPRPILPKNAYLEVLGLSDLQAVYVPHCHGAMGIAMTWPNGFKVVYSGDTRPTNRLAAVGKGASLLIHEATFDDELKGDAIAKMHSTTGEALGVAEKMGARGVVLTHFSQRYQRVPVMEYADGEAGKPSSGAREDPAKELDEEEEEERDGAQGEGDDTEMPDQGQEDTGNVDIQSNLPPGGTAAPSTPSKAEIERFRISDPNLKVAVANDLMRLKVGDIVKMEKFVPALVAMYEREGAGEEGSENGDGGSVKNGKGGKAKGGKSGKGKGKRGN